MVDAAALGLGDAELRSRLNEPLAVEIDVVGVPRQSDELTATIGTESGRGAAGGLSSRLRAQVSVDQWGRAHIRVSTGQGVREPIVSFLLVVESAREHVMREYTLLLDPPGYSLPVLTTPDRVRPAVPDAAVAVPPPSEPKATLDGKRIGPVARGETLSGLAMRHGTGPGVTWAQTTWALFTMNPHAFIDGDINKLRPGVYLEMPSRVTVSGLSHHQALDLVKAGPVPAQIAEAPLSDPANQSVPSAVIATPATSEPIGIANPLEYETSATSQPIGVANPPEQETSATTPEPSSESPQPLFRVLSSGEIDTTRSAGIVGSPASPREQERVLQLVAEANLQIRDSHEQIVMARKQLADTVLQISTLVETVKKKDSVIKSLESRLAELREFVKARSVAATDSDANWLQRLLLEMLILGALVGVLAVMLIRRNDARGRPDGKVESGAIALDIQAPTVSPALPATAPDENEVASALPEEEHVTETADIEEPSIDHAGHEEIELRDDRLTEANAYFAYGYHEKAKEVLEAYIKENPANAEGRLVMLRVLHAIREKRKFRRHAEALLELVGDESDERWVEAARLGRSVLPEERLFNADARKRAADDKWEQTVWTGTLPDATDCDDQIYLDIDEFKYVDLFLLDGAEKDADTEEPGAPNPSSDASAEFLETEAKFAKWRAETLDKDEDRTVRLNQGVPTDDPVDVPTDDPVDIFIGDLIDDPIDDPIDDTVDVFIDDPTDDPTDDTVDVFIDDPIDDPMGDSTDVPIIDSAFDDKS